MIIFSFSFTCFLSFIVFSFFLSFHTRPTGICLFFSFFRGQSLSFAIFATIQFLIFINLFFFLSLSFLFLSFYTKGTAVHIFIFFFHHHHHPFCYDPFSYSTFFSFILFFSLLSHIFFPSLIFFLSSHISFPSFIFSPSFSYNLSLLSRTFLPSVFTFPFLVLILLH